MYQPGATYRIQFNRDFTFKHFKSIIPYLHRLGIKTIYAAPIFKAVPGSVHGYDGTDSNEINPEIGTLAEFKKITDELKKRDMGWIQDFVPNHVAYTTLNDKIRDVMLHGSRSAFSAYFDYRKEDRIMAPFLGNTIDAVLADGSLKMVYDKGDILFRYFDNDFPVNDDGLKLIVGKTGNPASIVETGSASPDENAPQDDPAAYHKKMAEQTTQDDWEGMLERVNKDKALMSEIHELQYYRLCHWQETDAQINYRRFFTINGLIGINIQQQEVFDQYHQLLFQLIADGRIQGVRIDHIDGLYDPQQYLNTLRRHVGSQVYIVVEKILEADELLPNWPVQGTTGYDFLAMVNNLLLFSGQVKKTETFYRTVTRDHTEVAHQLQKAKTDILEQYMHGEWDNLVTLFLAIPGKPLPENVTPNSIAQIIRSVLVHCPVYRYYPGGHLQSEASLTHLFNEVRKRENLSKEAMAYFLVKVADPAQKDAVLDFWRKCMQVSGPLMAKGMEDTLMYRYHHLLALNEVGDSPANAGMPVALFHKKMMERQQHAPLSMNATATHDTKRGEDARARLQLITHDFDEWQKLVLAIAGKAGKMETPARAERYMVLQALYASLHERDNIIDFEERLNSYLQKAAREGKLYSSWEQPDEEYEHSLFRYAGTLMDKDNAPGKWLWQYLIRRKQAFLRNQLVQLALKCLCPGIPDIYQGTELEDLSFVDPDNRKAVDYKTRQKMLDGIETEEPDLASLLESGDAKAKIYLLHKLLQLRNDKPLLFSKGAYIPVAVNSSKVIAFIRRYGTEWLLAVLPLGGRALPEHLVMDMLEGGPGQWRDLFTGEDHTFTVKMYDTKQPFGIYLSTTTPGDRKAGTLLPLFSLPSPFGIGDLGKEAYAFVRSLSRAGLGYWQMLPLNPLTKEQLYSPYASLSAFAHDPVFIDLRQLAGEGYLDTAEVDSCSRAVKRKVDYGYAKKIKSGLLRKAYQRFGKAGDRRDFDNYCTVHDHWLNDYAQFIVLKTKHKNSPWFRWPEIYKDRHAESLSAFVDEHKQDIDFEKWLQYIFSRQWERLKQYCHARGVALIGDVPFYMAADSADVWANRNYFLIDEYGRLTGGAGVPPDYFSATGQMWGMPVYHWKALQKEGFDWWLRRLHKNAAMYDIVRLDHFRAFYDYWQINADAETAKEGQWMKGPQDNLFALLKKQFPDMSFIAEDLGEIHEGVFAFKDKYRLPGMRVVQFGFENYQAGSRDLPHHFNTLDIAYTGTHDNDTLVGWYHSLSPVSKQTLSRYTGMHLTGKNIAGIMCRLLLQSTAHKVIIPVQDIIGSGTTTRINTPATTSGNWSWIFKEGRFTTEQEKELWTMIKMYDR